MKTTDFDIDLLRKRWQESNIKSDSSNLFDYHINIKNAAKIRSNYDITRLRLMLGMFGSITLMIFLIICAKLYIVDMHYAIPYAMVLIVTILRVCIAFIMFITIQKMNPIKHSIGCVVKAATMFSVEHKWNHIYTFYFKIPITFIALPPSPNLWIVWIAIAIGITLLNVLVARYFFVKQKKRIAEFLYKVTPKKNI